MAQVGQKVDYEAVRKENKDLKASLESLQSEIVELRMECEKIKEYETSQKELQEQLQTKQNEHKAVIDKLIKRHIEIKATTEENQASVAS